MSLRHILFRAAQRYGLILVPRDVSIILARIGKNDPGVKSRPDIWSKHAKFFELEHRGARLIVCAEKEEKTGRWKIITVYPEHYVNRTKGSTLGDIARMICAQRGTTHRFCLICKKPEDYDPPSVKNFCPAPS